MLRLMSSPSPRTPRDEATRGDVALRDAGPDDAEAIEFVHYAAREAVYGGKVVDWPPPGPDRPGRVERWRTWLSSPDVSCIVAERDGRILGFCTIRPSRDDDASESEVEMPTLYVHPDAWGRGLGRALCDACVARARDRGFRALTLWVLAMNERARRFYDAFGFEPDGTTKIDEGTTERLAAHRYRLSLES
jgi:ribosomal protein S18 acetylase RimI-like enzyme